MINRYEDKSQHLAKEIEELKNENKILKKRIGNLEKIFVKFLAEGITKKDDEE
jgi:cell division protein FtsB